MCVEDLVEKQNKTTLFQVTEPSSVPYRTPSACAKMAAFPDPPPVILLPESIAARSAYSLLLRPEIFPGIGALPEPATGSHVVNRGTPVAPSKGRLIGPERKVCVCVLSV